MPWGLPLRLVKFGMNYVETIPFKTNSKEYVLLVQTKKSMSFTDYHVTALTNDAESKLRVNFAFRWEGRVLDLLDNQSVDNSSRDFIDSLRETIYAHLILKKVP